MENLSNFDILIYIYLSLTLTSLIYPIQFYFRINILNFIFMFMFVLIITLFNLDLNIILKIIINDNLVINYSLVFITIMIIILRISKSYTLLDTFFSGIYPFILFYLLTVNLFVIGFTDNISFSIFALISFYIVFVYQKTILQAIFSVKSIGDKWE